MYIYIINVLNIFANEKSIATGLRSLYVKIKFMNCGILYMALLSSLYYMINIIVRDDYIFDTFDFDSELRSWPSSISLSRYSFPGRVVDEKTISIDDFACRRYFRHRTYRLKGNNEESPESAATLASFILPRERDTILGRGCRDRTGKEIAQFILRVRAGREERAGTGITILQGKNAKTWSGISQSSPTRAV